MHLHLNNCYSLLGQHRKKAFWDHEKYIHLQELESKDIPDRL